MNGYLLLPVLLLLCVVGPVHSQCGYYCNSTTICSSPCSDCSNNICGYPTPTPSPTPVPPAPTTPTPFVTPAPLRCKDNPCGAASCCDDGRGGAQCFDNSQYTCSNNGDGTTYLCPKGSSVCNTFCFETDKYDCCNGNLSANNTCGCKMGKCAPATATATAVPATATPSATATPVPATPTPSATATLAPSATVSSAPVASCNTNSSMCTYGSNCVYNGSTYNCVARRFLLRSKLNNLYVDSNATYPGAAILMEPKNTSANSTQIWTFENGFFIQAVSGLVIDIINGNATSGNFVQLWNMKFYGNINNQLWAYNPQTFHILSQDNFLVLDIYKNSVATGAKIDIYVPNSQTNQQFVFDFM